MLAVQTINERKQRQWEEEFLKLEEEAQSDCIYFINTDHLGTPQEVVSEDGKIVWLARYKGVGTDTLARQERDQTTVAVSGTA